MKKINQLLFLGLFIFFGNNIFSQSVFFTTDKSYFTNCRNYQVQFNNETSLAGCNYFVWNFGDGDSLVSREPYGKVTHTYKSYGNFTPVLTAYYENAQNALSYKGQYQSFSFYINGPSLYIKDSICPNEILNISFYNNGQVGKTFFDFGNGKTAFQTTYSSVTTKYTTPGTYSIKTIFTNANCNNTIDTIINKIIVSKSLKANSDFYLSKTVFCPNEPVSLNASSSDNISYTWDMGDKTTYTGNNINHVYKDEWDNVIKLTTKNACGNTSTTSKTVKVSKSASKYFKSYVNVYSNKNQACVGEPINFNASSDFSYKSIVWNFKDNTINSSENYTNHSFKYTGTYLVQAKLTNHCDIDTIVNLPITIKDLKMPFKNISSLENKNVCPGEKVSYWVDNYNNQIKNYSWILPNNVVITNESFDRTFNEGENIIYLRMSNYCGNDTMISAKINVNKNQPISKNISFQQNQLEFCPNEEFDIRYNSSGIKTFTWVDVSPISQDNGYSGTFKFPSSGDRLLKLKLTSYCGKDTTISTTIKIVNKKPINVSFYDYYFNKSYCPGNEVYFSLNGGDESSNYKSTEYDYGDGITGSSSSHIYKNYGNYLVKLKLTNFCNNDTTIQNTIKIERSSINKAIFISTDNNETEFCQGDEVGLNISQNYNYQDFKNVVWDFGDGEKLTSDNYVNHAFKKTGLLTVKATVTSFCDDTLTIFKQFNIRNDIAYKGYIDDEITDEVCPGERADFYVNGNFKSVTWDFGDNTPFSNQKNTTHIYDNAGYYTVTIKVKNQCDIETILQKSVEVSKDAYPDVDIDELIDYACPGEKLPFFVGTSSKDNTLTFDFGDNNKDFNVIHDLGISNYKIIAHKFTTPGTYNVTLKAVNKCGNSDSESETIVVKEGVKLDPNSDIEDIFNNDFGSNFGDTIAFLLESNGLEFTWDFGNNEIKKTDVGFIKHKFSSLGNKTVNVTVKTACGETLTYTTNVIAKQGNTTASITKVETQVLQVYPNPSNGNFTISGAPIGNYKIYNELGISVNQFEINEIGNHTVNLKNNAIGIYFIVGEDNNIRQKISVLE